MHLQTIRKQNLIFFLGSTYSRESKQKFPWFLDLHKIYDTNSNIKQKLHKKEKEKHCSERPEIGSQAGPLPPGPRGRCARCPLSARSLTSGSRSSDPPSSPLCETLTSRPHLSASSPSRVTALPQLQRPIARSSAPARVRVSSVSTSRPRGHPLLTLYPIPSTSATGKAGGRHSRPWTSH